MDKYKFLVVVVIWCLFTWSVFGQFHKKPTENEYELRSLILNSNATKPTSSLAYGVIHVSHPTAFFCRQENALEETVKIPIRFRLGEWNYTQQLEGKGHLYWKVNDR